MPVDEAKLNFQPGSSFPGFFDLGDNLSIAIQKQFGYCQISRWTLLQHMECRFKQEVWRVEFLNFVGFLNGTWTLYPYCTGLADWQHCFQLHRLFDLNPKVLGSDFRFRLISITFSFEGWIIQNVKSVPSGSPGSDLILVIGVVKSFAAIVIQKAKSLSTRKGRSAGNAKVPTIKSPLISLELFGPNNWSVNHAVLGRDTNW